ncbi:hypothetical protein [Candidatus Xianfuyuplasma coldseepsis]|uniref:Uncharacterized protein n=1 Tax=Candidatus Xianfuyuplasma coldseepsis TaxID=2782163 RepID=A0A7L7KNG2_9MOLU|nr:hypothetical protein [Xianfuyuplasma coldseepsis]QMS84260.1 hypothetical protein G4Z02_00395 [Xianfuyuplasma coldseepsis]
MWNNRTLLVLVGIFMVLTRVDLTNVCACSPVIYRDTTLITVDGDEFDNSPEYFYDLLFNKVDYPGYYQETVNNQFIMEHPSYETFAFLEEGDWVSYKAHYSGDIDVWESGWNHEFIAMSENTIQEYKIIVFDDDGKVIKVSSIYNKDDFGYYGEGEDFGSVAHTFDETTEEFGEEAIGNGCAGWSNPMNYMPLLMFGIYGLFLTLVIVIIIVITIRRRKFNRIQ